MSRKGKNRAKKSPLTGARTKPQAIELRLEELEAILERARVALSAEEHAQLAAAIQTLAFLTQEIEAKGVTLARLRKLLFGSGSERTRDVLGRETAESEPTDGDDDSSPAVTDPVTGAATGQDSPQDKPKPKGHGRKSASDYTGADKKTVPHASLEHKGACPCCAKGRVYRQLDPAVLVRVRGVAPLAATTYELERLRCNLCGEVFTADSPPGVGSEKYDETAAAMIGLLKYGCGLPFYRIERLGDNLGIPLPTATQWDVAERTAEALEPAWAQLVHLAAQGEVLYIDDTKARVLELNTQLQRELAAGRTKRTGIFTSGVVATVEGRRVALFFTSRKHAGENLAAVLEQRSAGLPLPIQMGDASSRNTVGDFEALVASCLVHGRRNFVDVAENFPEEVRYVLECLGEVFGYDAKARERRMDADERLRFHQTNSGPKMEELEKWLQQQFDDRKVEPNSSLGGAIRYMQRHWAKLTLFLREPGAPLENNICERVLKKAILHRKNSLFYKTPNGAHAGDVFMSLIHTAELCRINPFEYLVALQHHRKTVAHDPADWMPWNYRGTLAKLGLAAGPVSAVAEPPPPRARASG